MHEYACPLEQQLTTHRVRQALNAALWHYGSIMIDPGDNEEKVVKNVQRPSTDVYSTALLQPPV
jgi:hypothetical protein